MFKTTLGLVAITTLPLSPTLALAEVNVGGYIESDARLAVPGKDPEWTFMRLDNTGRVKADVGAGDVAGHARSPSQSAAPTMKRE